jgi:hypothetical protein
VAVLLLLNNIHYQENSRYVRRNDHQSMGYENLLKIMEVATPLAAYT